MFSCFLCFYGSDPLGGGRQKSYVLPIPRLGQWVGCGVGGCLAPAWLGDPERLQEMKTNARNAGRPFATYRIAQDLGTLLFEGVPHPVA